MKSLPSICKRLQLWHDKRLLPQLHLIPTTWIIQSNKNPWECNQLKHKWLFKNCTLVAWAPISSRKVWGVGSGGWVGVGGSPDLGAKFLEKNPVNQHLNKSIQVCKMHHNKGWCSIWDSFDVVHEALIQNRNYSFYGRGRQSACLCVLPTISSWWTCRAYPVAFTSTKKVDKTNPSPPPWNCPLPAYLPITILASPEPPYPKTWQLTSKNDME